MPRASAAGRRRQPARDAALGLLAGAIDRTREAAAPAAGGPDGVHGQLRRDASAPVPARTSNPPRTCLGGGRAKPAKRTSVPGPAPEGSPRPRSSRSSSRAPRRGPVVTRASTLAPNGPARGSASRCPRARTGSPGRSPWPGRSMASRRRSPGEGARQRQPGGHQSGPRRPEAGEDHERDQHERRGRCRARAGRQEPGGQRRQRDVPDVTVQEPAPGSGPGGHGDNPFLDFEALLADAVDLAQLVQ